LLQWCDMNSTYAVSHMMRTPTKRSTVFLPFPFDG
jgi:hypothetical protein